VDPVFLTVEEILEFHEDQIRAHGGSLGVRDMGMLQSAVAMPRSAFGGQFAHSDLHEMAAAYLFHIAQNHPFIDGNKRAAAVACVTFLASNGLEPTMSDAELVELTLSTAEGKRSKSAIAEFLRAHTRSGRPAAKPGRGRRKRS
jgi:death-on-curing protein